MRAGVTVAAKIRVSCSSTAKKNPQPTAVRASRRALRKEASRAPSSSPSAVVTSSMVTSEVVVYALSSPVRLLVVVKTREH